MKKSVVFMFSGQGSQYYCMGKELYNEHSRFRFWMNECDKVVRKHIQVSLIDMLYHQGNKSIPFDRLLYTNPAIISVEYSLARVLMEMDIQADYLLGYSLGEVTALILSGALSFDDGVHMAIKYADLLEKESPPCGMLVIIDSENLMHQSPEWFENCWLTGRSFPGCFVVNGLSDDIQRLGYYLTKNGIIYQKLPVNYGFHTQIIDPVEERFKSVVRNLNFGSINTPIISSVKSGFLTEINEQYLWEVGRQPVEFQDTIRFITKRQDCIFIDVGPSGSLNTFVKYLLSNDTKSSHFEVMNQYGADLKTLDKLQANLNKEFALIA